MRESVSSQVVKYLANLGLILLALIMIFFVLELTFRGLGYSKMFDVYSKQSMFWEYDPLLGWRHRKNARAVFSGPKPFPIEFSNEVKTNSIGLRGGELRELSADGFRVLILGDSKVAGFEVEYEQSFVYLLQKRLTAEIKRPVQVINAGVRGYGADQSFLYLVSRGHDLKPDLVVFMTTMNDSGDNISLHKMKRPFGKPAIIFGEDGTHEVINAPVPRYEVCSAYTMNEQYQVQRIDTVLNRTLCKLNLALLDHSVLASFVLTSVNKASNNSKERMRWLESLTKPPRDTTGRNVQSDEFQRRHMSLIVRAMGAAAADSNSGFLLIVQKHLLNQIDKNLIPGVKLYSYDVGNRDTTWKNDGHLNVYGHRVVADQIWQPIADMLTAMD